MGTAVRNDDYRRHDVSYLGDKPGHGKQVLCYTLVVFVRVPIETECCSIVGRRGKKSDKLFKD